MTALLSALERGKTRARVRTAAVALAGVALLGAGVQGYRRWDVAQRVEVCELAGAEIDEAWNDEARGRLRETFMATGVSYAATTEEKVTPWLDERAAAWKQARTEVCLNGSVRNVWDEALLRRAMWCLEDRQMEMESLVAEFGKIDATVVQKAVTAVASLRTVASCLDEDMLLRQPAPPTQGREGIREVRLMLSRAQSLGLSGSYKEALSETSRARERAETVDWPPLLAAARAQEGKHLANTGDYEAAEMASSEAYFAAASSGSWDVAARAAVDLIYTVGHKRARHMDGQEWSRHAEVALAHFGEREGLWESARLGHLAAIHSDIGKHAEALEMYERSLKIEEQIHGPLHPNVAGVLNNKAAVYKAKGAYPEAQALYERALALGEHTLGHDHPDVAARLQNLGDIHRATGKYTEAEILHKRALALREQALGPEHPDVAVSLQNLAVLYLETGAYEDARSLLERAIVIQSQALGPDHPTVANTMHNLAGAYKKTGEYAKALELYERSLGIKERSLGLRHPDLATVINQIAGIHMATGSYPEARKLLERALFLKEQALGPDHPDVAGILNNLGMLFMTSREYTKARTLLERALVIKEKVLTPGHPDIALTLGNLAEIQEALGARADARTLYERTLAMLEQSLGANHPEVARILYNLANMHLSQSKPGQALPLLERASAIYAAHDGVQVGELEVHFGLAKALVATGGARARALVEARKARDGFRGAGASQTKQLAEVERWLRKH